jgi:hypothetical protein
MLHPLVPSLSGKGSTEAGQRSSAAAEDAEFVAGAEGEFSLATDVVCAAGVVSGLGVVLAAAFAVPDASRFLVYATIFSRLLLYWGVARTRWGRIFGALLGMGVIAGLVEILADYFLIHWTRSGQLVYPPGDAILLDSPLWMPLAWTCVITELGYLILRLGSVWGNVALGSLVGGPLAGVTIGVYEYLAYRAGWWHYGPARRMLGPHCALYVPAAEVVMFLLYAFVFDRCRRVNDPQGRAIARGSLFGLVIFASYAASYVLFEVW